MTDMSSVVEYFYIQVPDRPGEAARILTQLRDAGVNLLAFSAFPERRRTQMDFVPKDAAAFKAAAKKAGWKLTGPRKVFLIAGQDRVGAVAAVIEKIAAAKINITATQAVAGAGQFGALLWVKPRDVKGAARALGIA